MTPGVNTWWWGDDYLADLKVRLVGFNIPYLRIRTVALWSRDGKGIATRLWTGRSQVRISAGTRDFFSSAECPDQLWGQHRLLVKGYGDSFPGLFRPGPEVDY